MRIFRYLLIVIAICSLNHITNAAPIKELQNSDSTRLRRLQILADIWGKAFLFHPNLVRSDRPLDWSAVLDEAIPIIERSKTTHEFVSALNSTVFKQLHDASTFAIHISSESKPQDSCLKSILLPTIQNIAPHIAYLNFSCFSYRDTSQIIATYSLIKNIADRDTIVIDFRPNSDFDIRAYNLVLKCLQPLTYQFAPQASVAYQQYRGWNNFGPSVYQQQWVVTGPAAKQSNSTWFSNQFNPAFELQRRKALPSQKTVILLINKAVLLAMRDELAEAQRNDKTFVLVDTLDTKFINEYASRISPPTQHYIVGSDTIKIVAATDVLRFRGKIFSPDTVLALSDSRTLSDVAHSLLSRKAISGIPDFTVESPYKRPDFSREQTLSRETKLRGLMKTWTILGYLYPHLPYSKKGWDSILTIFIPKVEQTSTTPEYHLVMQELMALLGDSHSAQWVTSWQWNMNILHIPFKLKKVQGKVIVTECASSFPRDIALHVGDEVLAINGKSIGDFEAAWKPFISASTENAMYGTLYSTANLENICKFSLASIATLSILNNQGKSTLSIPLAKQVLWKQQSQENYKMLENDIGYIQLFEMTRISGYDSLIIAFEKNTKGLILDLRGYPKLSHFELLSRLISKPVSSGVFEAPLVSPYLRNGQGFSIRQSTVTSTYSWEPHPTIRYTKPIIALIDESLISAAEDFCLYLKSINRVVFVGSVTTGTDGDIAQIQLPGEASLIFTGSKVRHFDGTPFQRIGILPDFRIRPTVNGIREGRDEILEKGIDVVQIELKKQSSPPSVKIKSGTQR